MRSKRPLLFTVLGVLFSVAGLVTTLGLIMSWNLGAPIRGEFFGYVALNFLLAYGFFKVHRWLLPALAVNWLLGAALSIVKIFVHNPPQALGAWFAVSFCLGGLVFLAVYMHPRKKFSSSGYERQAGAAFLIIWAATVCYTMVGLFT